MNRTPNSKEILTYFSEFLTQIGALMGSIKKHMYELIEVPMPTPKINSVFNSMSSIVFSTHRTYKDLKKIEAVIAGFNRSRESNKNERSWSLSSTRVTQAKCKTEDGTASEFFNIKRMPKLKQSEVNQNLNPWIKPRSRLQETDECYFEPNDKISKEEYSFNKQMQSAESLSRQQNKAEPGVLMDFSLMESKIKEIMGKNRRMFRIFASRNQECLELLSKAKQDLMVYA